MNLYRYTDTELKTLLKTMVILCDTREQANDHITGYLKKKEVPYQSKALSFGGLFCYDPSQR
jgi:hypothetical protein